MGGSYREKLKRTGTKCYQPVTLWLHGEGLVPWYHCTARAIVFRYFILLGFFCLVLFLLLLLLFWQCSRHAEVPSLGSNLCHSSGRSHSRDNARSLISRLPGNSSVCMFLFSSLFFSNGKGNKSSSIMVLMNRKGEKKKELCSQKK